MRRMPRTSRSRRSGSAQVSSAHRIARFYFEDPTGVRLLYDRGNTVAGATDARLGDVNVILISHAHSDHLGNGKLNQNPDSESSSCGNPLTTDAPSTNTA